MLLPYFLELAQIGFLDPALDVATLYTHPALRFEGF